MIAVIVEFNTDENGEWVAPWDRDYLDVEGDLSNPMCVYGPFLTMRGAIRWMDNKYPQDDTDVHDMYIVRRQFPKNWTINNPRKFARMWKS